jgi:hypothetical protein
MGDFPKSAIVIALTVTLDKAQSNSHEWVNSGGQYGDSCN